MPNAGQANYGSAKAGIAAMTLVAAEELERYGVRVNAIAPIARTRLTLATPGMGADLRRAGSRGRARRCSARRTSRRWWPTWPRRSARCTGKVFARAGRGDPELAGWHDADTIETDGPWTIDDIAARLPQ